jgi:hypothetical protein
MTKEEILKRFESMPMKPQKNQHLSPKKQTLLKAVKH